jgi:hypothetical protein
MAKASSTKRGASPVSIRQFITLQAKLAAREVIKELKAAGKGGEKAWHFPMNTMTTWTPRSGII